LRQLAYSASQFKSTAKVAQHCEQRIAAAALPLQVAYTTVQAIAVVTLPLRALALTSDCVKERPYLVRHFPLERDTSRTFSRT
jgi:hypothetical protein